MKWFSRKRDYFVSYAHANGFGNCVMSETIIKNPLNLNIDFARVIKEKEKLDGIIILNWIKL